MPFVTRVGVRRQPSGQAALGRGGDFVLLSGVLGRCPASHVWLCVAKALNIKSEAGRGFHLQTAQKPR